MRIVIDGKPISWKRPGQTREGHRFDTQKREKNDVMWIMKDQFRRVPIDGAVKLTIHFIMPIPASWPQRKQLDSNGDYHINVPDLDNLEKFYKDAMSGIAYKDDKQVALVIKSKRYGIEPRTEIIIEELI